MRSQRFGPERVRQPGWVVSFPKGLFEVRFGNRKGLVDLLDLRGEGAEAWAYSQTTPAFEADLRRPLSPGDLHAQGAGALEPLDRPLVSVSGEAVRKEPPPKHLRIAGRPFVGQAALLLAEPSAQPARPEPPRPPSKDATVVLKSTRPGVVAQRSAMVVGESGLPEPQWQRICELPCRFQVEPGRYRIQLDGPHYKVLTTELNFRPGENEILVRPGTAALHGAGVAAIAAGAVLVIAGVALAINPMKAPQPAELIGPGVGSLALGITLFLLGRTTLDARPPPAQVPLPSPAGRSVGLGYGARF